LGVAKPAAQMTANPFDIYRNEITIIGSRAVLNSYSRALALLEASGDSPKGLVGARFALNDIEGALTAVCDGTFVKVVVDSAGAKVGTESGIS